MQITMCDWLGTRTDRNRLVAREPRAARLLPCRSRLGRTLLAVPCRGRMVCAWKWLGVRGQRSGSEKNRSLTLVLSVPSVLSVLSVLYARPSSEQRQYQPPSSDNLCDRSAQPVPYAELHCRRIFDRAEMGRPPHDVVDGQLADEPAVDLDRERQGPPLPGHPPQPAHQRPVRRRAGLPAGRDCRVPRPQPRGVAPPDLAPGGLVGAGQRPQRHLTRDQPGRPRRQWSLPTTCSTACTSSGSSTVARRR